MVVYIVNDILYIIYKNRVIKNILKDVICRGFIVDKEKFMDAFLKIVKKEKIKSNLFGDNITILKSAFYTVADIFFLETIFNELGFIKIKYLEMKDFFSDDKATYVEINDSYMVLYLDNAIYLDLNYFKDIPMIFWYFKKYFGDYLILFGSNKNISKIKAKELDIYYVEQPEMFILTSLLKVNKYEV